MRELPREYDKWEYLVQEICIDAPPHNCQGWLNNFGKEGWELVSVVNRTVGHCSIFTFKRPK